MVPGWILIAITLGYITLLSFMAWQGDHRAQMREPVHRWPLLYSLTLAVYCSAWSFLGGIGQAASSGFIYLTHFIGPIIGFLFFWPVLDKLIRVSKRQNVTSIADFIASRYGKSQGLAALCSLAALVITLPYMALQFDALRLALHLLTPANDLMTHNPVSVDGALLLAVILAVFAMLHGMRHTNATEHHEGLIQSIAFESVFKLLAFLVLGAALLWKTGLMPLPASDQALTVPSLAPPPSSFSLIGQLADQGALVQTVLTMLAIICVPRQFHVTVVEHTQRDDTRQARWLFVGYLIVTAAMVMPLALQGRYLLGDTVSPDGYLMALAAYDHHPVLSVLAFICVLTAAGGMLLMASLTLSIMLSNEVVIPILLKLRWFDLSKGGYTRRVLRARRAIILLVVALGYWCSCLLNSHISLASLGLLALAGMSQMIPAVIGGLYWKHGNRIGVAIGILLGLIVWGYTLLLPTLVQAELLPSTLLTDGPLGLHWLRPLAPFGLRFADPLTQGVLLSLGLNIAAYIGMSQLTSQRVVERIQASLFVESAGTMPPSINRPWLGAASVRDLKVLCRRFLDKAQVEQAFERFAQRHPWPMTDQTLASIDMLQFSEGLLASAIGSSSARLVMNSALSKRGIELSDVVSIVDEASQVLEFNRSLLQSTVDNLQQGISVIDHNLNLVVWNRRYLELFDFPDNLIRVGTPIERIFRYNAYNREYGPGDSEEHVAQMLANLESCKPHHYLRYRQDGTVLDIHGSPMPGGGFVYTYQNITQQKRTEEALIRSESNIRIYTDNVPALIAYFDTQCHYLFTNRAYETGMGVDRTEAIGKQAKDILPPYAWREREPWMMRALAGERVSFELAVEEPTGQLRHMLATYTPHFNSAGRVLGFFALYQDITERRLAEIALKETNEHLEERVRERTSRLQQLNEALQQENEVRARAEKALRQAKQVAETANASKTRFLAAASHDLLQPLNAARLFTSALNQQLEHSEYAQTLSHIDASLQSAEELLSTLLDISKLDAGALTPRRKVFALSDILRPLKAQFEVIAADRGLDLAVVDTSAVVDSDPQMLRRIVQNFLSNALRYTEQGRVLLGCRHVGDQIRIEVWDTGPGIPKSKQKEIFEEFRRLDSQSRHAESEKGLGLGLSIAERMANVLEHELTLNSEVGRGTVFRVTVPYKRGVKVETHEEQAQRARRPASRNRLQGTRILCIDNERITLEGMKAMLSGWECDVYTATSIGGARSILRNMDGDPDVILADYHLSNDVTGLMALDTLGQQVESEVPGIVITADRTEEVAETVKRAGYHLINKPVRPATLRALLTRTLQARRASDRQDDE